MIDGQALSVGKTNDPITCVVSSLDGYLVAQRQMQGSDPFGQSFVGRRDNALDPGLVTFAKAREIGLCADSKKLRFAGDGSPMRIEGGVSKYIVQSIEKFLTKDVLYPLRVGVHVVFGYAHLIDQESLP